MIFNLQRFAISKTTALAMLAMYKKKEDTFNENKFVQKVTGKALSANDFTDTYKNKLDGIAAGAQVNIVNSIDVDGDLQTNTNGRVTIELGAYAKLTDLTPYAKSADLTTVLVYKGTVANYADLPTANLKVGYVYNITNAGGTDSKGVPIKAGDNVAYCESTEHVGGWDVLGGTTDLSDYINNAALTQTLGSYVTSNGLSSTLADYYTQTAADNKFLTQTNAANNYVAKVSGKGLSTNDFTDTLKQRLESLYDNANEQITQDDIDDLFATTG